jgi:hypothetical protein
MVVGRPGQAADFDKARAAASVGRSAAGAEGLEAVARLPARRAETVGHQRSINAPPAILAAPFADALSRLRLRRVTACG